MRVCKILLATLIFFSDGHSSAQPKDPFDEYNESVAAKGIPINPHDQLKCISSSFSMQLRHTCEFKPDLKSADGKRTLLQGTSLVEAHGLHEVKLDCYVDVSKVEGYTPADNARLLEEEMGRARADLIETNSMAGEIQKQCRNSIYEADHEVQLMKDDLEKPCNERNHQLIYKTEVKYKLGQQDKYCDPKGYWGKPVAPWLNQSESTSQMQSNVVIMSYEDAVSYLKDGEKIQDTCNELKYDLHSKNPERVAGALAQLKELGCEY